MTMFGCCCKQQDVGQPVEVTQVTFQEPADASDEIEAIVSAVSRKESAMTKMSSRRSVTSKACKVLSVAMLESCESEVQPNEKQDGENPMERMDFVRQMSANLTGQLGIDLDKLYASEDHDVSEADVDIVAVTTLSEAELDVATKKVIESTQALLPKRTMSDYQRSWCTPKLVQIYLDARDGDIGRAAESLALALIWREGNKELLQGHRLPKWQGDMRVLTRSPAGHPMVYTCMANQVRFPNAKSNAEHMGLVLNTACENMRGEAMTFDWIFDCHGFRISSNLDPRPAVGLMEMLKHPFRDRLRRAWMVDAPKAFSVVWNVAYPHMPATTREKITFAKQAQVLEMVASTAGLDVANAVRDVMAANRAKQTVATNLPSELKD